MSKNEWYKEIDKWYRKQYIRVTIKYGFINILHKIKIFFKGSNTL